MSLETQRAYVEGRLQTFLAASYPTVKMKPENAKWKQPDNATFVAVYIIEGDSFQSTLGNEFTERHTGIIQIDIMTPEGQGTSARNILAERLGDLFGSANHRLTDGAVLRFRTPVPKPLGNEGMYDRLAVTIPFWRDERKTAPSAT